MDNRDLMDLVLSGVKWELTEIPMAFSSMAQLSFPSANTDVGTHNTERNSENVSERTHTSIVPPIMPQIAMSVDTAAAMASRPVDIDSLCRMIAEFNHPLRGGATNVVLPHIAPKPNGVLIITDVPGGDDDASGKILSGVAGDLLDKMLFAIDMTRENVSICPLVFWRTPGGRTPTRDELDLARPFVNRIINLLKPRLILTLGTLAAAEIANVSLPRGHGIPVEVASGATLMPIFHPNYLILKPAAKREAWIALQLVQNLLKSASK